VPILCIHSVDSTGCMRLKKYFLSPRDLSDTVAVASFRYRRCLPQGSFRGERVETPFPLLKSLKTLMDGIANHFQAKNALHCRILHIISISKFSLPPNDLRSCVGWGVKLYSINQSKFFRGVIPPDPPPAEVPPGAWTETRISAWLAGVPTVPVLRNDRWFADTLRA